MKPKTALKTVLIILGVIILAVELTLLPGQRSHDLTHPDVQVNPPQKVIDKADVVKEIGHTLVIPKQVIDDKKPVTLPVDVTVKDKETGETTTTETEAKVTPTEDGGVKIEIPDTITVTLPEPDYRFKIVGATTPDLMLGYSIKELDLKIAEVDVDVLGSFNSIGIGASVEVKRVSVGIGEVYEFHDNELRTIFYVGYSF